MANYLSPLSTVPHLDANGDPYSGAKLFTYAVGSSTKVTTYKDEAGNSAHANPIVLNTKGLPADGSGVAYPIWQIGSTAVKYVLAPSDDTDPPASPIETWDNIDAINDVAGSFGEWVSGSTPTYVDATSFTVAGDQTGTYHVGRKLKTTNTAGTVYSYISATAYTTLTTVTVVNDSGTLDSGLSAVSYGVISATNTSFPVSGQIVFPATQNASSNANTLDDYEEGTWTPAITFSTPGDLSVSYTAQSGTYTKVGNLLQLNFKITTSSFTHTTASGELRISGLGVSYSGANGVGSIFFSGITKANYTNFSVIATTGPYILVEASGSGQAYSLVSAADMPTGGTVALWGSVVLTLS